MAEFPLFMNVELVRVGKDGGEKQLASQALQDKTCAIYFSASWCAPCAQFTPTLKDFYEEVNAEDSKDDAFEVVWVSSDDDEKQFEEYSTHHGNWLAVPYDNVELRNKLKQHFGVCAGKEQEAVGVTTRLRGIPTLAIIRKDGTAITLEGDEEVEKRGPPILQRWSSDSAAVNVRL